MFVAIIIIIIIIITIISKALYIRTSLPIDAYIHYNMYMESYFYNNNNVYIMVNILLHYNFKRLH